MSKIAETKALKEYPNMSYPCDKPSPYEDTVFTGRLREAYERGYDQAIQDVTIDADRLQYLSDELGYAYACGCTNTMHNFMDRAKEFFHEHFNVHMHDCHVIQYVSETPLENIGDFIEQFKNYMQNEN